MTQIFTFFLRINTITLEDDAEAGGWKVGDTVVIASTDFNFEQVKYNLVGVVNPQKN